MDTVRALRRSRGITLVDLAILSGIPARTLGAVECGMTHLDPASRAQIACVLGVSPDSLRSIPHTDQLARNGAPWWAAPAAITALAATLALSPLAPLLPTPTLLRPAPRQPAQIQAVFVKAAPTLIPTSTSIPTPLPTSTPQPTVGALVASLAAFIPPTPLPDEPSGCPLNPTIGQVVITQGYAVGTHAPASIWGALDLAIDGDGDGMAEPETTYGTPIIATISGIARVFMNSWPGGNYVRIESQKTAWRVAYAHLDTVAVSEGQLVKRGMPIGTVGTTGMSSGPHLHYEIWRDRENLDPDPWVTCGDR